MTTQHVQAQHQAPASADTAPQSRLLQRTCACGRPLGPTGECAACRRKRQFGLAGLRVNRPGDRYEQEADRVADAVLTDPAAVPSVTPVSPGVQAQPAGEETTASGSFASVDVQPGGGQPLEAGTRAFFEPRFGHDFGQVRIHADGQAARSARQVNARAFTVGPDVYFDAGEYQPRSNSGCSLLAHELTHVIQQNGGSASLLQRQEADEETDDESEEEPQPGTSQFVDEVAGSVFAPDDQGVQRGIVRRRELYPGEDPSDASARRIHSGILPVEFDRIACEIRVPHKVAFQPPSEEYWPSCSADEDRPVPPAPEDALFNAVRTRFLRTVNTWMNGWYSVRLTGCDVCQGQDIPIRVEVEEVTNPDDADTIVVLADTTGRACVSGNVMTLHLDSDSQAITFAHEAGHAVLEVGDEYPDEGDPVERVREDDWSLMSHSRRFTGRSLLHRRHFQFVLPFMRDAVPGCTPELVELSRPVELDVRGSVSVGGNSYLGRGGMFVGLGAGLGLPFGRQREWETYLEGRFTMLTAMGDEARTAWLLGARLGVEYRLNPSAGGLSFGGFGELGYGWFETDVTSPWVSGELDVADRESAYGEAGVSAAWNFGAGGFGSGSVGLEAAYGRTFDQINLDDSQNAEWFRLGLSASIQFWAL